MTLRSHPRLRARHRRFVAPPPKLRRRRPRRRPGPRRTPAPIVTVIQNVTYVAATVGPRIALVNNAKSVSDESLAAVIAALSRQVNEDFAKPPPYGYGIGATLRWAPENDPPRPDEWQLILTDHPDIDGAEGYHDESAVGMPIMYVFPKLSEQDGVPWPVVASHEILETLVDPNLDRGAQQLDGRWWAYETCDAVEADIYYIDGVPVSNFVLPPYFEPTDAIVRYDHLGLVTAPLEIRPGGYGQFWDGTEWQEVLNFARRPRAYRRHDGPTRAAAGRTTLRARRVAPEMIFGTPL